MEGTNLDIYGRVAVGNAESDIDVTPGRQVWREHHRG